MQSKPTKVGRPTTQTTATRETLKLLSYYLERVMLIRRYSEAELREFVRDKIIGTVPASDIAESITAFANDKGIEISIDWKDAGIPDIQFDYDTFINAFPTDYMPGAPLDILNVIRDFDLLSHIEGKRYQDYIQDVMSSKAARFRAVAKDEDLSDAQLRDAIDSWKAAHGKLTTRDHESRVAVELRPAWNDREGSDLALTPPEFIQKYYTAELAAGTLHKGVIYSTDRGLYTKLNNWQRSAANELPVGFDLPTKSEWLARRRSVKASKPTRPPAQRQTSRSPSR